MAPGLLNIVAFLPGFQKGRAQFAGKKGNLRRSTEKR
jgi:hypothetical protein